MDKPNKVDKTDKMDETDEMEKMAKMDEIDIIFFHKFLYYVCLFSGIFQARCMMRSLHNIMTSRRGHYTI